jgi:hypothetical protein
MMSHENMSPQIKHNMVWAYKEFQKGKEGSRGWNDGMID